MASFKLARALQPGDRVQVLLGGLARVVSCKPTERTMVRPGRRESGGDEAVGLLVVYDLVDGSKRGTRTHDVIHPEDKVKV